MSPFKACSWPTGTSKGCLKGEHFLSLPGSQSCCEGRSNRGCADVLGHVRMEVIYIYMNVYNYVYIYTVYI